MRGFLVRRFLQSSGTLNAFNCPFLCRACECCSLRRTALYLFKKSPIRLSARWKATVAGSILNEVGRQSAEPNGAGSAESVDCNAPSGFTEEDEAFLVHSGSNLVFAFLILHYIDQNSPATSSSCQFSSRTTILSTKRDIEAAEATLNGAKTGKEKRWLQPVGVVVHPDSPETTRSALLCMLSKTFFPDEFRIEGHAQQKHNSADVSQPSSSSSSSSTESLITASEPLDQTSQCSHSRIQRELNFDLFVSEWLTPQQQSLQAFAAPPSSCSSLAHQYGLKTLWKQLAAQYAGSTR